jgi:uncharacterized membrane protein
MKLTQIQTIILTVLISTVVSYFLTKWMDKQFLDEHKQNFHQSKP